MKTIKYCFAVSNGYDLTDILQTVTRLWNIEENGDIFIIKGEYIINSLTGEKWVCYDIDAIEFKVHLGYLAVTFALYRGV